MRGYKLFFVCLLIYLRFLDLSVVYQKSDAEKNDLFAQNTLQGLLDELDVIECFCEPGKAFMLGEVLKKQKALYEAMEVTPLYAKPSLE